MEEVFILRHGHAEDLHEAKDDFNRKLTDEGKLKIARLSTFLNSIGEEIELVLSSPYLRTKETTEIFTNNLDYKPKVQIEDFLSLGASSKDIAKGLLRFSSYKKILIVGHAPDLEAFLGNLIGATRIKLKKGALAKVILNNQIEFAGELEWLIAPRLLKKSKEKKTLVTKLPL